jgi:hypothetical protein
MVIMLAALQAAAFAEESTKDFSIIPILGYEYLMFDGQKIHSANEGIIFTKGNMMPTLSEERNSLMIGGVFQQFFISEVREGYEDIYHKIELMADRKIKRHLFLGLLSSEAAQPIYGGLHTFAGGLGYGYELIRNENVSLTLGGILVVTDTGLELSDGMVLPVAPLPVIRFDAQTSLFNISFEFLKNIKVGFTFLPESKIRLTGYLFANPFMLRSIDDLLFDTTLWYRFFSKDSNMGDFAGLGLGFKNHGFGFALSEKGKYYEAYYHSAYGILDLSFLKLSAGYAFNSREIYDVNIKNNIGNGFFINAMLAWQF